MREVKKGTAFCEEKGCAAREAKKLFYSGAWALACPMPKALRKRSLFGSFSAEKELLPALNQMAFGVTLDTFNVMPAPAPRGAPRHPRLFFSKLQVDG